jgi:hypothetical protein
MLESKLYIVGKFIHVGNLESKLLLEKLSMLESKLLLESLSTLESKLLLESKLGEI